MNVNSFMHFQVGPEVQIWSNLGFRVGPLLVQGGPDLVQVNHFWSRVDHFWSNPGFLVLFRQTNPNLKLRPVVEDLMKGLG